MEHNISFLRFEDWRAQKETSAQDWMVVARFQKDGTTDFFTFSALASASEGNLEKIVATHEWEVSLETFVKPFYYRSDSNEVIYYGPRLSIEVDGIEFFPFIIDRDFQGYRPRTIELVQHFILYHNAFFVPEKCEYHYIDSNGNIRPVVRLNQEKNNHIVLVDTHCLKEYLTALRCYLVRYHDHLRTVQADVGEQFDIDTKIQHLCDGCSCFLLTLSSEDESEIISRFLGKDLVLPYPPITTSEEKERYIHFVIGRDERGKEIESTCDGNNLNPRQFLTPVFFQRKVLNKYYQEPRRYTVSDADIRCLNIWYLSICATEEDLVQVWLGDLGRIPYEDQMHWRQWNVPPRGRIPERRIRSDLLAEFVLIDEPVSNFRMTFEQLQEVTQAAYREVFFLVLDEKDRYAYETLHVPLSDEEKEFDEQVQALAKVAVDSLNVALLSRIIGKRINGNEIKGSIALLGVYLTTIDVDKEQQDIILSAFHAVQSIRSTGSAHRKGEKFARALQQFGLDGLTNAAKIKKLLRDLTRTLAMTAEAIRRRQE